MRSAHNRFFVGLTLGAIITASVLTFGNAQLVIPTSLSNAFITIQQILLSTDGLDTPSNTNKINIYADSSVSGTLVIDGGIKVTGLESSGPNYLVTTDSDGYFSLIDGSILSGGAGSNSVSGQWLDSPTVLSGIYYPKHVGIGVDADISSGFALHVFDEKEAIKVTNGDIQVNPFSVWVGSNGSGVVTANNTGVLQMSKVTESMLSPSLLSMMGTGELWQEAGLGHIYYTGGFVGIGTNNPLTELFVNGDALATRVYVVNGLTTLTNSGSDAYWFSMNNIIIGSRSNSVGIGGVSPMYPLHIKGKTYIDSEIANQSGLKFAHLTSGSTTNTDVNDVDCKVLSVDEDGDVILVDGACGSSSNNAGYSVHEICGPCTTANGNNVVKFTLRYTGPGLVDVEIRNPSTVIFSGNNIGSGDEFIFHGTQGFWGFADPVLNIYVDNGGGLVLHDTMSNECGSSNEPGNVYGDFVIVAALTEDQSIVCPVNGFNP